MYCKLLALKLWSTSALLVSDDITETEWRRLSAAPRRRTSFVLSIGELNHQAQFRLKAEALVNSTF